MTNFDPATLDWNSALLSGWTYDKPVNKWFQGSHRSCYRLTRPCPTCRETIVLDVTRKVLTGEATNHGLALRRCKKCREALKLGPHGNYAERKALGAERRAAEPEEVQELERLRKEVERLQAAPTAASSEDVEMLNMELNAAYRQLDEAKAQIAQLRARYELQPQIAAQAAKPAPVLKLPEPPLTMAESTARINAALAEDAAKRQAAAAALKNLQAQNTDAPVLPNSLPWA